MLRLGRPADHDRFNATLHDVCNMRFNGGVVIDGAWDADLALRYLERRNKNKLIPTMQLDGSVFQLHDKGVFFRDDQVLVVSLDRPLELEFTL